MKGNKKPIKSEKPKGPPPGPMKPIKVKAKRIKTYIKPSDTYLAFLSADREFAELQKVKDYSFFEEQARLLDEWILKDKTEE